MKALVPFLVLPLFVSSLAAQKTKLTDFEAIQVYEDSLLQNLNDGQYDVLEDQFEEVQDRSVQMFKFKTEPRTPRPHVHTSLPTSFDLAFDTDAGSDPSKADSLDHGDSQS
jgi:hypothetical protein